MKSIIAYSNSHFICFNLLIESDIILACMLSDCILVSLNYKTVEVVY